MGLGRKARLITKRYEQERHLVEVPTTSPTAVRALIHWYSRGKIRELPDPAALEKVGLKPYELPDVFNCLQWLGLVDEEGHATATLRRWPHVSENEFRTELAAILRSKYKDVFAALPAKTSNFAEIAQAFGSAEFNSKPFQQAVLFTGLYHEAGIVL